MYKRQRLYNVFPREQIHIILFDDFVRDTKTCYDNVLNFLQLPSDGRTEFPPENVRQSIKSPLIAKAIWKLRDRGTKIKRRLGIVKSFNLITLFRPIYEQTQSRPQLSNEFKKLLVDEFKKDVELLSRLMDRDLSHWLNLNK